MSEIIDLYVNQKKGIMGIKRQLNLPYSPQKIKESLRLQNIHIRGVSESNALKRLYEVNDDYNFNTHNGAWILGLFASDGYLPITKGAKHKVVLTLQRSDEETLQLMKQELEYTGPIYQYESTTGYPNSSLSITSRKIREQMESYGITNKKSFTFSYIPPTLSEEMKLDFIRGYFDGDGGLIVNPKEKKINMDFTSANKNILVEISEWLHKNYDVALAPVKSYQRGNTTMYYIRYYKRDSLILGGLFYDNDYLSLLRKKNKFLEAREKYPIERIDKR